MKLVQKVKFAFDETRMLILGAQALLGFQLAIVLTAAFEKLPALCRGVHALSLCLVAVSVMLLMAPAAYHRIVFEGDDSLDMYRIGSGLITSATVPPALGLAGDMYVVIAKIAGEEIGAICAALSAAMVGLLWYGLPFVARRSSRSRQTYEESAAE